ncbi:MAG: alanine dehydrogenase [Bacteroidetes bacterium]|nr:alanine dehydrogenase [Rhodothermia bacterium]MCS7154335.1 alanine dehydrogenase [Bacteroidota bacterium]MCX7906628.1 alanine dehydrogenase [Bacteroidota bacterium]MDW8137091.1 alanine dehydrogenase [Bacteroidota bacterium]MDW8285038.1 alanine dehydrogenase [Bacteroidota bacterium]
METRSPRGITPEWQPITLERPAKLRQQRASYRIGVPREIAHEERRVSLVPYAVAVLVANGHQVFVEKDAGRLSRFGDRDYVEAGAEIALSAEELYEKSDLIVKIAPPTEEEWSLLRDGQVLISALHLGVTPSEFFRALVERNVTGIGYEFIQDTDQSFPLVRMMHEIAGSLSVQIAAHYLESPQGGQGIVLGGISGVPPATVVILGAGTIAEYAARTALGFGAQVVILDDNLSALRRIENALDRRVITAMANTEYIARAVRSADVLIGAVMRSGYRAPIWVTEEMVASMKPGSVIVDVVIDQGGCIETSRPTTLSQPVYVEHGVTHYCVPNMPATVARTASLALTNVLLPLLLEIGEAGSLNDALWRSVSLRTGTYVYRRYVTKKHLASQINLPHRDIELLIASGI